MNDDTYTLFFASLSVLVLVSIVLWLVLFLDKADKLTFRRTFSPLALELAAAIAITATAGSLFLQFFMNLEPCRLCWVQRGFMYPAAGFLLLELVRRKVQSHGRPYFAYAAGILALCGLPVSIFHRYEQAQKVEAGSFCDPLNPCSTKLVEHFSGLVTIPTMAGIAFVGILFYISVYLFGLRKSS